MWRTAFNKIFSFSPGPWQRDDDADFLSKEEKEVLLELENPEAVLQTDPVLSQFQQSQSLPRNVGRDFNWREGRQPQQGHDPSPPVVPPKKKQPPARSGSSDVPGVQQQKSWSEAGGSSKKSSDDMQLEHAFNRRPHNIRLISTPDVVRSTMAKKKEEKYTEETIDSIIATPKKIVIPERYVPEVYQSLHFFAAIVNGVLILANYLFIIILVYPV